MSISLFNPKTRTFVGMNLAQADLPTVELLLFNILVELQVLSQQYADGLIANPEEPATIRTSLLSEP